MHEETATPINRREARPELRPGEDLAARTVQALAGLEEWLSQPHMLYVWGAEEQLAAVRALRLVRAVAPAVGAWVPVAEGQPVPHHLELVIIQFEDETIGEGPHQELGHRSPDGQWYIAGCCAEPVQCTHWMARPKAAPRRRLPAGGLLA